MSKPYRIVYVEDDPMSALLMKELFGEFSQYVLTCFDTAEGGLDYLGYNPADLVILDINLPGMSGIEAVQWLRRNPATMHIPAIALSADALPSQIQKGLDQGFNKYLTKPLDLEELIDLLPQLLGQ